MKDLALAAAKLGLDRRDIPPCLTLFADVRAEMDLLVALSNTPPPLDPHPTPGAVGAVIWASGAVPDDDPCRTAGPEARRA